MFVIEQAQTASNVTPADYLSYLSEGLAPSTRKQYMGHIHNFNASRARLPSTAFKRADILVPLYLASLTKARAQKGVISSCLSALSWTLVATGTQQSDVSRMQSSLIVKRAKRMSKPTVHRPKVALFELDLLRSFCSRAGATPADKRLLALCLLAFGGYLRISEATALLRADITASASSATLEIRSSKCQQPGIGTSQRVIISRTGSDLCPVTQLLRWFQEAPPSAYAFPNLSTPEKPISSSAIQSHLKRVPAQAGISRSLGTHSMRGGAATLAAERGVPEDAIRRAGRVLFLCSPFSTLFPNLSTPEKPISSSAIRRHLKRGYYSSRTRRSRGRIRRAGRWASVQGLALYILTTECSLLGASALL